MNEPGAKPLDRLTIGLALATLLVVNLAVVAHFTATGGALAVKALLGLSLIIGGVAWLRLKKTRP